MDNGGAGMLWHATRTCEQHCHELNMTLVFHYDTDNKTATSRAELSHVKLL